MSLSNVTRHTRDRSSTAVAIKNAIQRSASATEESGFKSRSLAAKSAEPLMYVKAPTTRGTRRRKAKDVWIDG